MPPQKPGWIEGGYAEEIGIKLKLIKEKEVLQLFSSLRYLM